MRIVFESRKDIEPAEAEPVNHCWLTLWSK